MDETTVKCTLNIHYSSIGLDWDQVVNLVAANIKVIEVRKCICFYGQMVATYRYEGVTVPVLSKRLKCDLKTVHLYVLSTII